MGDLLSAETLLEPLLIGPAPLAQRVVAIDPRYCEPRVVTLHVRKSSFPTDSSFRSGCFLKDGRTDAVRFEFTKTKKTLGMQLSRRFWLLDANRMPIANYKSKKNAFSATPTHYVHAGSDRSGVALFQITAHCNRSSEEDVV